MTNEKRQLRGSCYCGNLRFVFTTDKTDADLPKRECQCSFCLQHGRISTYDPEGALHVSVTAADEVSRYRFGLKTAEFHVCRTCGNIPVVTSEIDDGTIGLVDVRMIENFPWSRAEAAQHDFEGETVADRHARRKGYWIGTVTFD